MLSQRRRRWTSIKPILVHHFLFVELVQYSVNIAQCRVDEGVHKPRLDRIVGPVLKTVLAVVRVVQMLVDES